MSASMGEFGGGLPFVPCLCQRPSCGTRALQKHAKKRCMCSACGALSRHTHTHTQPHTHARARTAACHSAAQHGAAHLPVELLQDLHRRRLLPLQPQRVHAVGQVDGAALGDLQGGKAGATGEESGISALWHASAERAGTSTTSKTAATRPPGETQTSGNQYTVPCQKNDPCATSPGPTSPCAREPTPHPTQLSHPHPHNHPHTPAHPTLPDSCP